MIERDITPCLHLLFKTATGLGAIEIKSSATIAADFFDSLNTIAGLVPEISMKAVVYAGTERQLRTSGEVVPFNELYDVLERLEAEGERVTV